MYRDSSAWDNDIVRAFNTLIPYLPHILEENVILGITDRVRYIRLDADPSLQPAIKKGDLVSPEDAIYEALRLGTPVSKTLPADLYGVAVKATGIPIKDIHGQVIGGINIVRLQ